jgi:antitoxin YefM
MQAISYTAARANLAATMKRACQDHEPVTITLKSAGAVVMLSLADYEALNETAYLLRSPPNAKRLAAAVEELEAGRGQERTLVQ